MVVNEDFSYGLIYTDINSFSLHPQYRTDEELPASNCDFRFGTSWKVVETNETATLIDMSFEIRLLRREDRFQVVVLDITGHYTVSLGLTFDTKLVAVSEIFNNLASQAQGMWHIKIANPKIAAILPQAYNKLMEQLDNLKEKVYEKWE